MENNEIGSFTLETDMKPSVIKLSISWLKWSKVRQQIYIFNSIKFSSGKLSHMYFVEYNIGSIF